MRATHLECRISDLLPAQRTSTIVFVAYFVSTSLSQPVSDHNYLISSQSITSTDKKKKKIKKKLKMCSVFLFLSVFPDYT